MDQFNAINPEDITKIEYSYITPQRYVDKGYKGMISVTLKKRQDGGQVYLWARSAVNATFIDGLIQTSYHKGASQFSVIYNPSWRNDQDAYDNIYGTYTGHDYELKIEQHDRSPFNYHTHALRLDYSFVPGDRTLFSVRFAAVPTLSKMRLTGDVQNSQLGNYTINNSTSSKDFTPSLDLFVRHEFNEKNSIEAQVVGTVSSSDYRRNNNYLFDDGHNDSYVNNIDNHRRSLISEISYVHNFDQTMRLSGGVQNTLSHNRNVYLNSANNYNPVLTENNNYIYASFAKQFTKVYLSASTGLKMFWTRNDQLHRHFIHNMSSVNLAWYISQSWFLQADFGYTPYIPTLSSLTDYMQQTEPYMFQNGNPNLKVQENLTYALTANFKHKKFSATLKTGYYDFKNSTTYDITYLGNGKFLSHSVNSDKDNLWMGLLQMGINDVHGFGAQVMLRLRLFDCHIADWSRSLTSFDATLNLWWNKGPWTISYYRKFPGKSLNGYQVNKAENMDMLQLEYRPDRHWSFGIAWWYMFDKKGGRYPYWNYSPVANLYIDRYIKDSSNMVTLSACYTADFGALFKRNTNRSLNNTDSNNSLLKN
ncbi:MAG: outer membrane beta-barrel family protein [Muribaculaceae bacterium]|nr:outer membrane beta-barrel family protein [Muribaculaceae bacterium]